MITISHFLISKHKLPACGIQGGFNCSYDVAQFANIIGTINFQFLFKR
jgi:hypothetical protein